MAKMDMERIKRATAVIIKAVPVSFFSLKLSPEKREEDG